MAKYNTIFATNPRQPVPQSIPIPGRDGMVKNRAGGYVFKIDPWKALDRVLILGTDSPSFYANEHEITLEMMSSILPLIKSDGLKVVTRTMEISQSGRAPRNDHALFVLALCSSAKFANEQTRTYALENLPLVARSFTDLAMFTSFVQAHRGWGHSLQNAISKWFTSQTPEHTAYEIVKYRNRMGWTAADLLRKAHTKPPNEVYQIIFKWAVDGWGKDWQYDGQVFSGTVGNIRNIKDGQRNNLSIITSQTDALRQIWAYEQAKEPIDTNAIVKLIADYRLTWEMIPTEALNNPMVWFALLPHMPLRALIRNLAKMTACGVFTNKNDIKAVADRICNKDNLTRARMHPFTLLISSETYKTGEGLRGKLTWEPVEEIVSALEEAIQVTIGNIVPVNKPLILAVDCSGSMRYPMSNMPIECYQAGVALCRFSSLVERECVILAFSDRIARVDIKPTMSLSETVSTFDNANPGGGTDISLPFTWALQNKYKADGIVIYTDNETWAGRAHPAQVLAEYRRRVCMTKFINVPMVATTTSVSDNMDADTMECVGLDASTPTLIADILRGDL